MKLIYFLLVIFSYDISLASYEKILSVAEKYNMQKKKMALFEKEKRDLLGKIYELEKETSKLVRDKSRFDRDQLGIEEDVKRVSRKIVELEVDLKILTKQMMKRWAQVQKMNELPWMYVLLSSYSPAELERMVKSFEYINKNEAEVVEEYIGKVVELEKERIKLHGLAKQLILAQKGYVVKEAAIKLQHLKRKKLLKKLDTKIIVAKKKIKNAKKLGKKLAGLHELEDLKVLFGSSFFEKRGTLPHPMDAPVKHAYGLNELLLRDNIKLLHKGYFYQSQKAKVVKAIAVGRIRYAKKMGKNGHTVIIDHGSNYYSVYSNMSQTKVKAGDLVEKSAALGLTGRFNRQFGEGLYFEIRHFSEPEDPSKWLKKRINNDKLAKIKPSEEGAS